MGGFKLLIGGELVDGALSLDVINPATGEVFETSPRADEAQLNQAIAAAKQAFPAWSALSFDERQAKLNALADAIEKNAHELARLLTLEQGKPFPINQFEVTGAAHGLRAFAAMRIEEKVLKENNIKRIIEVRNPLGVCAAIMTYNFPISMLIMKIGPGLITGNTFVAKPAPTTPLTTLKLAEIASEILPAGVLNVIVDDNDLGELLTSHPDVAKVTFTGSSETGKKVMASLANTLKRLTLELGGNDAAIVLDDADVKEIAPQIFNAAMVNSGQICTATKRVYAHSSVYEQLCTELARLANEAAVGDGLEQGVTLGPLQNKAQFEKVKGYVEIAHADGTVIAGGEISDNGGYFVAPTIVKDISDSSRLVQEEQFGPVLPILKFEDLDDAIARANDSELGLSGQVWTSNTDRGLEIARQIEAGTVWVNKVQDTPWDVPFRGAKQSGLGGENGVEAMHAYTQAKVINLAL